MPIAEGGCIYSCPGVHSGASGLAGIKNGHWMIGDRQERPLKYENIKVEYHTCSPTDRRTREEASADPTHRVLQLCVRGSVKTSFPQDENPANDVHVRLIAGEYCLWEPDTKHYWEVLDEDSLVITVAWPTTD